MTVSKIDVFIHETACVDEGATIGNDTRIWHFAHIFAGAKIGSRCSFGQNTMVSNGVTIGDNVKVQNNVAIYEGTTVEDDVFLGPSCVLTNVTNPRSQVVRRGLYERTILKRGATVGANATIVCGVTLGRYCFVAAGAVVTTDVADYSMVVGVPARHKAWMSRHGHVLEFEDDQVATCPESGWKYQLTPSSEPIVLCLDLGEDEPLPAEFSTGEKPYRSFKTA